MHFLLMDILCGVIFGKLDELIIISEFSSQ